MHALSVCVCVCVTGERAEGAEATLEAGMSKLTLTVVQKQEDSGDDQDPHYIKAEISSPSSATTILLLNSV